jgi:uncharacterized protein (TIGR00369 family)
MGAAPRAEVPFIVGGPEIIFRVAPVVAREETFLGAMETGRWVTGPDGRPCSGSLGVLLDDTLGYAVVHSRPADCWATTVETSVSFCAPIPAGASTLRAQSRAVTIGPSGGVAQVNVTDATGQPVAFGTQRMRWISWTPYYLDGAGTHAPSDAGPPSEAPTLEQLGGSISATATGAVLTLPPRPTLVNPMGILHGGISFCASEMAGRAAVQRPGADLTTASVHITFVRPGPVSEPAIFEAVTLHRGRTLAVSQVTSRNAAGKTCTLATVTCHRVVAE